MDLQAKKLNEILERESRKVFSLLSALGREESFPHTGIPGQTAEAKGTRLNATIGQAFEDDGSPMILPLMVDLAKEFEGKDFLYSPNFGQKALREAWRNRIKDSNPSLTAETSMPIVTSGLTHGLKIVGNLFVDHGQDMITTDMMWGNYKRNFRQAKFSQYKTFNGDYRFNVAGLEEKLSGSDKTHRVLLNFPNNPTGYTPTNKEADTIASIIHDSAERGNRLLVICDDAYAGLVYADSVYEESIFAKLADIHENVLAVKIDGVTKELYGWGLRVGFVTYGSKGMTDAVLEALEDKTAGMVRGSVSNVCTLSQTLVTRALSDPRLGKQRERNYTVLKRRYEAVIDTLRDDKFSAFFEPVPFNSGYFMCIRLKEHDPNSVRRKLIEEFSTGVISTGKMIRVAYSSVGEGAIPDILENIYEACRTSKPKR